MEITQNKRQDLEFLVCEKYKPVRKTTCFLIDNLIEQIRSVSTETKKAFEA